MDKGFQEKWEKENVKISPILIMWELDNRLNEIEELTKDDNIDENNYDSGYYDGLYQEKRTLEFLNNCILDHTTHEMMYPKSKVLEYNKNKGIVFKLDGLPSVIRDCELVKEVQ